MPDEIVIIGNGISGITAARAIREKSHHRVTVVSSESAHFISRTALMYAYMGHIQKKDLKPYPDDYWARAGIALRQDHATGIRRIEDGRGVVVLASGESLSFDKLIIATGSRPNRFGWSGEYAKGVQGLYSMQDLESLEQISPSIQKAVVVGGGLIGVELAEMLRSRNVDVTFLVREKSYMDYLLPAEESELVSRHLNEFGITFKYGMELESILVDDSGMACGVKTSDGSQIDADFVGLTVGVHPNVDFARACGLEISRGVLVDRRFETSVPGIFSIGDCAEFRVPLPDGRSVEQLWYSGRRHGQALGRNLTGDPYDYEPGIFFNSAKFFDLEYQTYGRIDVELAAEYDSVIVISNTKDRLLRIQYERETRVVVGFNALGLRLRHEVCETWIAQEATVETVLGALTDAGFDPEFSRRLKISKDTAEAIA